MEDFKVGLYECSQKLVEPYICFDSLIIDSRCPIDAECFWQGTAQIKVSFHERRNTHRFIMSLQNYPAMGYPNDTTINGYRVQFVGLSSYPLSNSNPVSKKEATLSISR
ncbi:MAG: hypothetical protein ABIP30_03235 [Ferruginibacter sp.]